MIINTKTQSAYDLALDLLYRYQDDRDGDGQDEHELPITNGRIEPVPPGFSTKQGAFYSKVEGQRAQYFTSRDGGKKASGTASGTQKQSDTATASEEVKTKIEAGATERRQSDEAGVSETMSSTGQKPARWTQKDTQRLKELKGKKTEELSPAEAQELTQLQDRAKAAFEQNKEKLQEKARQRQQQNQKLTNTPPNQAQQGSSESLLQAANQNNATAANQPTASPSPKTPLTKEQQSRLENDRDRVLSFLESNHNLFMGPDVLSDKPTIKVWYPTTIAPEERAAITRSLQSQKAYFAQRAAAAGLTQSQIDDYWNEQFGDVEKQLAEPTENAGSSQPSTPPATPADTTASTPANSPATETQEPSSSPSESATQQPTSSRATPPSTNDRVNPDLDEVFSQPIQKNEPQTTNLRDNPDLDDALGFTSPNTPSPLMDNDRIWLEDESKADNPTQDTSNPNTTDRDALSPTPTDTATTPNTTSTNPTGTTSSPVLDQESDVIANNIESNFSHMLRRNDQGGWDIKPQEWAAMNEAEKKSLNRELRLAKSRFELAGERAGLDKNTIAQQWEQKFGKLEGVLSGKIPLPQPQTQTPPTTPINTTTPPAPNTTTQAPNTTAPTPDAQTPTSKEPASTAPANQPASDSASKPDAQAPKWDAPTQQRREQIRQQFQDLSDRIMSGKLGSVDPALAGRLVKELAGIEKQFTAFENQFNIQQTRIQNDLKRMEELYQRKSKQQSEALAHREVGKRLDHERRMQYLQESHRLKFQLKMMQIQANLEKARIANSGFKQIMELLNTSTAFIRALGSIAGGGRRRRL